MGKKSKKKDTRTTRKGKKKEESSQVITGKDPIAVRVVFAFFMLFMIFTFVVGAFFILLMSDTDSHNGVFHLGDKFYTEVYDYDSGMQVGSNGMILNSTVKPTEGKEVGFMRLKNGNVAVCLGTVAKDNGDTMDIVVMSVQEIGKQPTKTTVSIATKNVLGVYEAAITNPLWMSMISSPSAYLVIFAAFVALTFVLGLIYYLVSPRGAKQLDKKSEEKKTVVQMVTTVDSENSALLNQYLSSDDNIQPMESSENPTGELLNINYYNSVRLHNGEVYTVVKKYQETVRRLEEYGASDMDLIRMNMIGNSEFDDLILNTHKEKSMTMWEIIDFARNLDGVYCIKKRGTLNWTFKYKSKTLFILKREDNDSESYKVSIKVYPDAATKLNIIYKALEDSSFPIGPYWYMFNDLRNLPANVIKWLISESLNISKWQQIKADLLRDTPTLESYKLDVDYLHDMVLANTRELDMTKFVIITQADTTDDVKYNTSLEVGFGEMNMDQYTKEITMVVPGLKNVQMSILTRKNCSVALETALCNELLDFATKTEETTANPVAQAMAAATQTTRVMKKKKR